MNSPSNQLRMLQQNFANLARTIGNLFLPIVEKVLPYINGLVMALQRLFAWIGSLLGIEFKSINSSMGGADNGMENFVSDTEDAGDALTDADKAAKKLKNTVLGFDELNQLNDNSDSSSGSSKNSGSNAGGGSPILDEAIAKALEEYQKAWDEAFARMDNKAQEVADWLYACPPPNSMLIFRRMFPVSSRHDVVSSATTSRMFSTLCSTWFICSACRFCSNCCSATELKIFWNICNSGDN